MRLFIAMLRVHKGKGKPEDISAARWRAMVAQIKRHPNG